MARLSKGIKKTIKIADIEFDSTLYPRTKPNWLTIVDYKESIKAGAKFPPIVVAIHSGKMYLVDGKHRCEAYRQNKIDKIQAIVHTKWSKEKIYQEAVRLNITHGQPLSPYEKRCIVQRLLEMRMKKQDVCSLVQVSMDNLETFVGERMVYSTTGNSGNSVEDATEIGETILKSNLKHLAGSQVQGDLTSLQKGMYSRDQALMLKEVISLLETETIDDTNPEVVKLLAKIKSLLRKWKFK